MKMSEKKYIMVGGIVLIIVILALGLGLGLGLKKNKSSGGGKDADGYMKLDLQAGPNLDTSGSSLIAQFALPNGKMISDLKGIKGDSDGNSLYTDSEGDGNSLSGNGSVKINDTFTNFGDFKTYSENNNYLLLQDSETVTVNTNGVPITFTPAKSASTPVSQYMYLGALNDDKGKIFIVLEQSKTFDFNSDVHYMYYSADNTPNTSTGNFKFKF